MFGARVLNMGDVLLSEKAFMAPLLYVSEIPPPGCQVFLP
jgi:hypothetical protein